MIDEGYELDEYSRLVIYKKYFKVSFFVPELLEYEFPPDFKFYFFGCRTNDIFLPTISKTFSKSLYPKNLLETHHIEHVIESMLDVKYRMEKLNV